VTVWYVGRNEISTLHTRHSFPKDVERSNKHNKKICAPSWFYLQEKKKDGFLCGLDVIGSNIIYQK
jgi:hypothetical protein